MQSLAEVKQMERPENKKAPDVSGRPEQLPHIRCGYSDNNPMGDKIKQDEPYQYSDIPELLGLIVPTLPIENELHRLEAKFQANRERLNTCLFTLASGRVENVLPDRENDALLSDTLLYVGLKLRLDALRGAAL
jgi:hypothetical protein